MLPARNVLVPEIRVLFYEPLHQRFALRIIQENNINLSTTNWRYRSVTNPSVSASAS
jgi:hypothetical protein